MSRIAKCQGRFLANHCARQVEVSSATTQVWPANSSSSAETHTNLSLSQSSAMNVSALSVWVSCLAMRSFPLLPHERKAHTHGHQSLAPSP